MIFFLNGTLTNKRIEYEKTTMDWNFFVYMDREHGSLLSPKSFTSE